MKKLSYRNDGPKIQRPLKTELPSVGSMNDTSTESGGRNGYILPGTTDDQELPDSKMNNSEHVNIIKHFIEIADNLDVEGLSAHASFVDFLIEKFAITYDKSISEEEKYIEYIYKIYNSDMDKSVDKIKLVSQKYSEFVAKSSKDKEAAKSEAFNNILLSENINAQDITG